MPRCYILLAVLMMLLLISTLHVSSIAADALKLQISSPAISDGATIPNEFTCSGKNQSPPLSWTDVPSNTKSLALLVEDPDAPVGTFVHWVVYDISPGTTGVKPGVSNRERGTQ